MTNIVKHTGLLFSFHKESVADRISTNTTVLSILLSVCNITSAYYFRTERNSAVYTLYNILTSQDNKPNGASTVTALGQNKMWHRSKRESRLQLTYSNILNHISWCVNIKWDGESWEFGKRWTGDKSGTRWAFNTFTEGFALRRVLNSLLQNSHQFVLAVEFIPTWKTTIPLVFRQPLLTWHLTDPKEKGNERPRNNESERNGKIAVYCTPLLD